jgi:8-oxo-dGTP pyrophosphatase MutT (NUDIX family)
MNSGKCILSVTLYDHTEVRDSLIDGECRRACRALIVNNDHLLLTHLVQRNQLLTPGGGIDLNESWGACIERECREELGISVLPVQPVALIREYYDGYLRFANLYAACDLVEEGFDPVQTEEETSLTLQLAYIPLRKTIEILAATRPHAASFELLPSYILRAIAHSPMRESYALAAFLGIPYDIVARHVHTNDQVRVSLELIDSSHACRYIENGGKSTSGN